MKKFAEELCPKDIGRKIEIRPSDGTIVQSKLVAIKARLAWTSKRCEQVEIRLSGIGQKVDSGGNLVFDLNADDEVIIDP